MSLGWAKSRNPATQVTHGGQANRSEESHLPRILSNTAHVVRFALAISCCRES